MDLDFVFGCDSFVNQELHNIAPMVSHELDDCAEFIINFNFSTTAPCFHERFLYFVAIQIIWKTLDNGQTFSGCSLHKSQVNCVRVLSLLGFFFSLSVELAFNKSLCVEITAITNDKLIFTIA